MATARKSAVNRAVATKKQVAVTSKVAAKTAKRAAPKTKSADGTISKFDPATGVGKVQVAAKEYDLDLSRVILQSDGYVEFTPGRNVKVTFDHNDDLRELRA